MLSKRSEPVALSSPRQQMTMSILPTIPYSASGMIAAIVNGLKPSYQRACCVVERGSLWIIMQYGFGELMGVTWSLNAKKGCKF